MQNEDTLFGKAERTKTDPAASEVEQAEALSRAARDAVRQPADPRIEKSFGHLAVAADSEPRPAVKGKRASSARARTASASRPAADPAADAVRAEAEALRVEFAAWRASAANLSRRLEVVTWILLGLTAIIGVLAVVLIVR